jgi:GcrA cell cycle regulator
MSWTQAMIDDLHTLWVTDRKSTTACAEILNLRHGSSLTKNSIIGKVNRLNLAYKGGARIPSTVKTKEERAATAGQPKPVRPKREKAERAARPASINVLYQKASKASDGTTVALPAPPPRPVIARAELPPVKIVMPDTEWFGAEAINSLSGRSADGKPCKWPVGDPMSPTFRFCNMLHENPGSYCEGHRRLAYKPGSQRPVAMQRERADDDRLSA